MSEKAAVKMGRVLSDLPDSCIPMRDEKFVPFGEYKLLEGAIASGKFTCGFIAGESGNGKTTMVEQACARKKRELVVVQITKKTTEAMLVGNFRLIDGETVYYYGPVVEAARRGAVLLLDELPQGDALQLMVLQNILANKPFLIKDTGELITPKPGFMVVATGNSLGEGDESSAQVYVGEEILNEAFRDRFSWVLRHDYAPRAVEIDILVNTLGSEHKGFAENLVKWAILSRENYKRQSADRQITTRRLLHICENFSLFGDKLRAIDLALNRYNETMRDAFRSAYFVIDPSVDPSQLQK